MKEISDVTCCVVDTGLFLPLATCMAEKCKRVLYWSPDMRAFPSLKQAYIGDGFDNIERVREFWPHHKEIDLWVFPDINQPGLQQHLAEDGHPVWGSRNGEFLENDRERFLKILKKLGLEVPPHVIVTGVTALRDHLKGNENKWIKISRYRGDLETHHWRSMAMDAGWLDWLAWNFGSLREHVRFLVFDDIDTDLEIGGDTYCVNGEWPSIMLNGLEAKDNTYFSAVTKRDEMPDQTKEVLEAFSTLLGKYGYTNQWSMEIRIEGEKAYFIDPTCRGGMPSSASQQLIWSNFPEIIWHGANGELLEPEPAAQFSIECMITSKGDKESWQDVVLPPELIPWARLSYCGKVDDKFAFPPDEFHAGELGWLVALGDTPRETLDRAKELADMLPDGLDAKLENLTSLIKEIDDAKEQGIPFTDEPVPTMAEVVED